MSLELHGTDLDTGTELTPDDVCKAVLAICDAATDSADALKLISALGIDLQQVREARDARDVGQTATP